MIVNNTTSFEFGTSRSGNDFVGRSVTLIVKGTFDLVNGGVCTPAKTQRKIAPDQVYKDDIGRSLAWSTDLAPFKPHTDFFVIGAFHQPNGVPAPHGRASITLGPLHKELVFHGRRLAVQRPNKSWAVTAAEPMTTVPLRWEFSFGGLSDPRNPMGMGIDPIEPHDESIVVPLPLIEDPHHLMQAMSDRPPPANFAPVPQSFRSRRRKLGTRDRRWAVFRAPAPPKDYDPSYHNAAPDDQQAGNYPRGDEELVLHNLHPTIPDLRTTLPGVRVRAGILRNTASGVQAEEITMHLDTVVPIPDEDQLVLVWRGVTQQHMAFLPDEVRLFQIEAEPLDHPAPSLAERMLAAFHDDETKQRQEEERQTEQALAEMRKSLAKAKLPAELLQAIEAEKDPMALFNMLDRYLMETVEELSKKYPQITTGSTL